MRNRRFVAPVTAALALGATGCKIENTFLPEKGSDTFYQVEVSAVDILFVVDNSASMAEEQAALASGFSAFMENLEGANSDFHIGVVSTSQDSTDPDRGKMIGDPPFLTVDDDYVTEFQNRVNLGTKGSDKEKGLEAAAYALSPEMLVLYNVGFLRPEANLLVIIVSDEEDCSDDGFLDGYDSTACYRLADLLTPVPTLINRIFDAKNNGEFVQIGAIVGPYDGSCGENAFSGRRYGEAALRTGGILGRICDADWSNVLYDLGLNAVGILDTFKLSNPADVTTLEVSVDEVPITADPVNGWTYDWQFWTLQFHGTAVPVKGATIHVEYDIAPYTETAGGTTQF